MTPTSLMSVGRFSRIWGCIRLVSGVIALLGVALLLGMPTGVGRGEAQEDQAMPVIEQLHVFLMPTDDRLLINEYYVLGNRAAEAYTGDPESQFTVVFPLPVGALNVQPEESPEDVGRYAILDGAIADTAPIPPGDGDGGPDHLVEVRFSYELLLSEGMSVQHRVPLAMESAVVLLMGDLWRLEGPGLVAMGEMDADGTRAQVYRVDGLAAGDELAFTIEPASLRPASPEGERVPSRLSASDSDLWLGIGVLALVVSGVAAVTLWKGQAKSRLGRAEALPDKIRDEVQALAALDDRFKAGELDIAAYEAARRAGKARIRALLGRDGGR